MKASNKKIKKMGLIDFLMRLKELSQGMYRNPLEVIAHERILEISHPFILTDKGNLFFETYWEEIECLDVAHPFPVFADVKLAYRGAEIGEKDLRLIPNFVIRKKLYELLEVHPQIVKSVEPKDKSRCENAGVYIIRAERSGLYKIGCSNDVPRRVGELTVANADKVFLYYFIPTTCYFALEGYLHKMFSKKRVRNEWYALDKTDLDALDKEVELMLINEKFNLGISVSQKVNEKYEG